MKKIIDGYLVFGKQVLNSGIKAYCYTNTILAKETKLLEKSNQSISRFFICCLKLRNLLCSKQAQCTLEYYTKCIFSLKCGQKGKGQMLIAKSILLQRVMPTYIIETNQQIDITFDCIFFNQSEKKLEFTIHSLQVIK